MLKVGARGYCREPKLFRHRVEFRNIKLFLYVNAWAGIIRRLEHYQGLTGCPKEFDIVSRAVFERHYQAYKRLLSLSLGSKGMLS